MGSRHLTTWRNYRVLFWQVTDSCPFPSMSNISSLQLPMPDPFVHSSCCIVCTHVIYNLYLVPSASSAMDGKHLGSLYSFYFIYPVFDPPCQIPQIKVDQDAADVIVSILFFRGFNRFVIPSLSSSPSACSLFLCPPHPDHLLPHLFNCKNTRSTQAHLFP